MENKDSILSEIEKQEIEAPYLQKAFANLIDFLIEITAIVILAFLTAKLYPGLLRSNTYAVYILVFSIMILYRFLCIMIFQKTIGMIVLRLKFLNKDLNQLTVKEKLIVVAPIRTSLVKIYKE